MHSYLSGRTQSVFVNGSYSSLLKTECGVTQGSCLGPLLYLLYKLYYHLGSYKLQRKLEFFADDTPVYVPGYSSVDIRVDITVTRPGKD